MVTQWRSDTYSAAVACCSELEAFLSTGDDFEGSGEETVLLFLNYTTSVSVQRTK
jgi:hypothetical protein